MSESCQTVSAQTYLWNKHFFKNYFTLWWSLFGSSLHLENSVGLLKCESTASAELNLGALDSLTEATGTCHLAYLDGQVDHNIDKCPCPNTTAS